MVSSTEQKPHSTESCRNKRGNSQLKQTQRWPSCWNYQRLWKTRCFRRSTCTGWEFQQRSEHYKNDHGEKNQELRWKFMTLPREPGGLLQGNHPFRGQTPPGHPVLTTGVMTAEEPGAASGPAPASRGLWFLALRKLNPRSSTGLSNRSLQLVCCGLWAQTGPAFLSHRTAHRTCPRAGPHAWPAKPHKLPPWPLRRSPPARPSRHHTGPQRGSFSGPRPYRPPRCQQPSAQECKVCLQLRLEEARGQGHRVLRHTALPDPVPQRRPLSPMSRRVRPGPRPGPPPGAPGPPPAALALLSSQLHGIISLEGVVLCCV